MTTDPIAETSMPEDARSYLGIVALQEAKRLQLSDRHRGSLLLLRRWLRELLDVVENALTDLEK